MTQRSGIADQWRAAPWTLKAYSALVAFEHLVSLVLADPRDGVGPLVRRIEPPARFVFWGVVAAALVFLLLRGSKAAWIVAIVLESLALSRAGGLLLTSGPLEASVWIEAAYVGWYSALLLLLIHPATHRWCRRRLRLTERPDVSQTTEQ